jgi:hypothetical protein
MFTLSQDLRNLIPNAVTLIEEFVQVNNEYLEIKALEEKTKVSSVLI